MLFNIITQKGYWFISELVTVEELDRIITIQWFDQTTSAKQKKKQRSKIRLLHIFKNIHNRFGQHHSKKPLRGYKNLTDKKEIKMAFILVCSGDLEVITCKLNRRETVKERTAHSMTPTILLLIENIIQIEVGILKNLYTSLILPMLTYGIKSVTTTKAKSTHLRNAERDIVQMLAKAVTEIETRRTTELLEGKQ